MAHPDAKEVRHTFCADGGRVGFGRFVPCAPYERHPIDCASTQTLCTIYDLIIDVLLMQDGVPAEDVQFYTEEASITADRGVTLQ
jgi:hypothetical protein